jgi:hypothetical protein
MSNGGRNITLVVKPHKRISDVTQYLPVGISFVLCFGVAVFFRGGIFDISSRDVEPWRGCAGEAVY